MKQRNIKDYPIGTKVKLEDEVFSAPAYRNIIKPIIKKISGGLFRVGDVVTDDGHYGEIVITNIQDNWIRGYSLKDGMVFNNLDSRQFKRVVGYVDLKIG